ncbi:hypothetical protein COO91_02711 [Nostoc flagelliforme CCNUN1]|uniref:Uncharacterized protein n=1 Tax=Nostoc flagelliforme CCNUN1 TaxID=2038116 RepID=A0A2K8SMU1_9NOSO|nr:hypothetical protein COO91_02711 [Nostoc flagelliforme CCNUN1]
MFKNNGCRHYCDNFWAIAFLSVGLKILNHTKQKNYKLGITLALAKR